MITNNNLKRFYPAKIFSVFLFVFLILLVNISCEEKPNIIGRELLEIDDTISAVLVDTVTIYSYITDIDGILSYRQYYSPLGSMSHPVYGRTDAGIYSQFTRFSPYELRTRKNIIEGTETLTLNLVCQDQDIYGDEDYSHHFTVYKIDDSIDIDLRSYSNVFSTGNYYDESDWLNPVTKAKIVKDTLYLSNLYTTTDTIPYRFIRIQLDYDRYKEELLDTLDKTYYYQVYNTDSTKQYVKVLKGLYIKTHPVSSGGCIYKLDYSNIHPGNYICLKYKYVNYEGKVKYDSLVYYSAIEDYYTGELWYDNRTNVFSFDRSTTDYVIPGLNDTINSQPELFLQSLGANRVILKMPSLDSLKEKMKNIILNKAILIVPVDTEDENMDNDDISNKLGLRYLQDGEENYLSDDAIFGYLGGYYDNEDNIYRFNVTAYLNDYFTNDNFKNEGLVLFVAKNSGISDYNASDVSYVKLLNSINTKQIKLKFIYTNLD